MSLRQRTRKRNAGINPTNKAPAKTTLCKTWLSKRTIQKQQGMTYLTPQIQENQLATEQLEPSTVIELASTQDNESASST